MLAVLLALAAVSLCPKRAVSDGELFYPGSDDVKLLESYIAGAEDVTPGQALEALGRIRECLLHTVFDAEILKDPGFPPADDGGVTDYVINKRTKRFHRPGCKGVAQIQERHRAAYHGTRDEIIRMGYLPCGNCDP